MQFFLQITILHSIVRPRKDFLKYIPADLKRIIKIHHTTTWNFEDRGLTFLNVVFKEKLGKDSLAINC